jgi:hypothetical protein
VAVGEGTGQRRAENDWYEKCQIERHERERQLHPLLGRGIEALHQIDVERKAHHGTADDGQRLRQPDDGERAKPIWRRRMEHGSSLGQAAKRSRALK